MLGVWALGCSSMSIRSDYDPTADFSELRTWAWLERGSATARDPRVDTPLVEARIRASVSEVLEAKGYAQDPAAPDFFVTYHLAVADRVAVREVDDYAGYGPGWDRRIGAHRGSAAAGTGAYAVVEEYQEGSLTLDVSLPERAGPGQEPAMRLVWRGSADARLETDPDPDRSAERVREAVTRILERFPPEAASAAD